MWTCWSRGLQQAMESLWVAFGTGNKPRCIHDHELSRNLEPIQCQYRFPTHSPDDTKTDFLKAARKVRVAECLPEMYWRIMRPVRRTDVCRSEGRNINYREVHHPDATGQYVTWTWMKLDGNCSPKNGEKSTIFHQHALHCRSTPKGVLRHTFWCAPAGKPENWAAPKGVNVAGKVECRGSWKCQRRFIENTFYRRSKVKYLKSLPPKTYILTLKLRL